MKEVGIGIVGLGTVGCGVINALSRNSTLLQARTGFTFSVLKAAVRDISKKRPISTSLPPLVTDWRELIKDKKVEIIVELIGGIEEARHIFSEALAAGKPVITGNKALLASFGSEVLSESLRYRVPIFFEAAVAGGIPIIKSVRESLVGNQIESLQAILNGTCNYILTKMSENGQDFFSALSEAQKFGYAEADPSLDVDGWDAAHKTVILAALAYGKWIRLSQIHVEGITRLTPMDFVFSSEFGCTIKLLSTLRVREDGCFEARVCPTLISRKHVLASVRGVFNAVWIKGDT
ncbi:MAG: homoserine dehydrogenase, partial [Chthoniobacterales bacterium]|nr:homoserine dehydrogenase [Chthoniobacterales bacterium]